ncbi:ROK family protein [Microbulbifer sp. ALW1]|uniref:ROK family protein n=1 Tax=Microbulbifer sp. (strain ALW1) TaxID=1516059 RepID=UPI0013580876|nr:ROK family protein [Microbulbifer sp. ALW1]
MADIIAIDLGGTKLNIGILRNGTLLEQKKYLFDATGTLEETLDFISDCITEFWHKDVAGIGIGVPCIVDIPQGIVFDAVNIPSWEKVHLRAELQRRFNAFVYINNDVNCFVAGEKHFGKGRHYRNIAGVCLGTGFGVGVYINNRLYPGKNCGAGELGSVHYGSSSLDDYCSGKFFTRHYGQPGETVFQDAVAGSVRAQACLAEFGRHLAQGLSTVLLAFDPDMLVLGGSVAKSYDYFIEATRQELEQFPFPRTLENLILERSELDSAALLGAAMLCAEAMPDSVLTPTKEIA